MKFSLSFLHLLPSSKQFSKANIQKNIPSGSQFKVHEIVLEGLAVNFIHRTASARPPTCQW